MQSGLLAAFCKRKVKCQRCKKSRTVSNFPEMLISPLIKTITIYFILHRLSYASFICTYTRRIACPVTPLPGRMLPRVSDARTRRLPSGPEMPSFQTRFIEFSKTKHWVKPVLKRKIRNFWNVKFIKFKERLVWLAAFGLDFFMNQFRRELSDIVIHLSMPTSINTSYLLRLFITLGTFTLKIIVPWPPTNKLTPDFRGPLCIPS